MSGFNVKKLSKESFWLKQRKTGLIITAVLGLILACLIYCFACSLNFDERIIASLTMLFLGLPTFFLLWVFRTNDTKENIHNNAFFGALGLLGNQETKREAIIQLMYLRNKLGVFKEQIDKTTSGINLLLN